MGAGSIVSFPPANYIKILIKGADWALFRSILIPKEYKNSDLDQLMNSRVFLKALKKKPRSEDVIFCTTANYLLQSLGT